jgi:uncharacterized protein
MTDSDLIVVDISERRRFELLLDGHRVGLADYSVRDEVITVPHVETDPAYRGQGFAAELMAGVLHSVRSKGQRIRPLCPYAAGYMRDRPETHDLEAR